MNTNRDTILSAFWSLALLYLVVGRVACRSRISLDGESNLSDPDEIIVIDSLPEPFSNDKLPAGKKIDPKNSVCFDHLGCFERLPISSWPQDPDDMDFQIRLLVGKKEELLRYEPTKHCQRYTNKCQIYPFRLDILKNLTYNPQLRTIVTTCGYLSDEIGQWQKDVNKIWSKLGSVNMIVAAWPGGNSGLYPSAVANSRLVGRQLTVFLYYLALYHETSIKSEEFNARIYMVGHSLGAHISGFVGKDLDGQVGRITGLDPAGPDFINFERHLRLDRLDAQLVDVLHTNGGSLSLAAPHYGIGVPIGHLDYYANDGQYQPSCNIEVLGCSHNAAKDLYISFLNHELYLEKHFGPEKMDYILKNRIFAYRSDSYEAFTNGSSFSQGCPISSLDDNDLNFYDIEKCLIPMDYVAVPDTFRHELNSKYDINFDRNSTQINKFYFYTNRDPPYLGHHSLVRVRVAKNGSDLREECDLILDMKMTDGKDSQHQVDGYKLNDLGDHYEVLLPYVSPNAESYYALAELDIFDFYIDDHPNLYKAIEKVLPKSINIRGLAISVDEPQERLGFFETLERMFILDEPKSNEMYNTDHECTLKVESVMVRPFKRLHRYFSATYTVEARKSKNPELAFLFDEHASPPMSKVETGDHQLIKQISDERESTEPNVYIATVVIGPRNEFAEEANEVLDDDSDIHSYVQVNQEVDGSDLLVKSESSFKITIFCSVILMLLLIVAAIKLLSYKRMLPEHRLSLISE